MEKTSMELPVLSQTIYLYGVHTPGQKAAVSASSLSQSDTLSALSNQHLEWPDTS